LKEETQKMCWKNNNNHFESLFSIQFGCNLRFMARSQVELMEITNFSGDKDKNEINLGEWLKMIREICKTPFWESLHLNCEVREWWRIIDKDIR
jgi:hypothetical protein